MGNYLQFDYDIADNYISINLGDLYQKEIRLLMLYINQKFPNNEGCKIQINSLYDTYKERIKYKEWEEKHTQKKKYMPPFKLGAGKGETCWEEFTSYKIVVDKKREAEKLHQQQEEARAEAEAAAEKAKQDALDKAEAEKLLQQQETERLQKEAEAAAEKAKDEKIYEVNTINKKDLDTLYKMNVCAYKGKAFQGSEYKFVSERSNNGYYGIAHANQENKLLIFTHRGTDSLNPWGDDKKNYDFITKGFESRNFTGYGECTQCYEAISFVDEVLKDDNYKNFSILITGHSLGALLSDITLHHLIINNNLNCKSIVFANPGSKAFLEKISLQKNEKLDTDLYKSISLDIYLKGDKLVNPENQLGSELFIDTNKIWDCPTLSDKPLCMYAGNNHILKNINSALNSNEKVNIKPPNSWNIEFDTPKTKQEALEKAEEAERLQREAEAAAEKVKQDALAKEEDERLQREAEAAAEKAKQEAERKQQEEARAEAAAEKTKQDALAKAEAEENARQDALAKAEAERKQQEEARAEAAEKAKQEALAKEEAEKLHQQQETERLQREAKAEEKAKLDALAKAEAERKQQEEAEAAAEKAKQEAHAEQHIKNLCSNQGIELFDEDAIFIGCYIKENSVDSQNKITEYGKIYSQLGVQVIEREISTYISYDE